MNYARNIPRIRRISAPKALSSPTALPTDEDIVALGVLAVVDIAVGEAVARAAVLDNSTVRPLVDELMPPVMLAVETMAGTVAVLTLDSVLDNSDGDVVVRVPDRIVNGVVDEASVKTLGIDRAVGLLPRETAVAVGKPVAAVTEPDAPQLAIAHDRQV